MVVFYICMMLSMMERQYGHKKRWQNPELTLISQGDVEGGGPRNGFKEHSHHSGSYFIKNGGGTVPVGKVTYGTYIHS